MKKQENFWSRIIDKKIVVFGTGSASRQIIGLLPYDVTYFVDNDSGKWGQEFCNSVVCSPDVLRQEDRDYLIIVVASIYYPEIAFQLGRLGFDEGKQIWNGMSLLYDDTPTLRLFWNTRLNPFQDMAMENRHIKNYLKSLIKTGSSISKP